jgi:PmbA protein
MIKSTKQGLLLCRFSGGSPSDNGDFSGVAKNSYYIEDGEIKFPISETMVTGNLVEMMMNIKEISKERVNPGYHLYPWIKFDGLTVSGKGQSDDKMKGGTTVSAI